MGPCAREWGEGGSHELVFLRSVVSLGVGRKASLGQRVGDAPWLREKPCGPAVTISSPVYFQILSFKDSCAVDYENKNFLMQDPFMDFFF